MISNLIPAGPGWRAVFFNPDSRVVEERIVVAWVLYQMEGSQSVEGVVLLDRKMVPACTSPRLLGYLEPGQSVSDLSEVARELTRIPLG